jgi:hypothetical protein
MDWLDELEPRPLEETWASPPRPAPRPGEPPPGLSNRDWVRWAFAHVAGRPDWADGYTAARMARDLDWGFTMQYTGGFSMAEESTTGARSRQRPFTREHAWAVLADVAAKQERWEAERARRYCK